MRERHSDTLGEDLLLVTVPVTDNGDVIGALRVSAPMGAVDAGVRSSWLALLLIGLVVVAAGLVLAWILAGSIARPVEKLRTAAGRLGRGDLEARVEPEGPQEIDELGRSFNRMAGALSSNLNAQRDFVPTPRSAAHAAHGIKLRPKRFVRRRRRREGGQGRSRANRLSVLVDDLLALARASSEEAVAEPVDLSEAVRAAERRWAEPAATAGHDLALADGQGGRILAAPADVAHILDNLIENAIRYSPRGAQITVGTDRGGTGPALLVTQPARASRPTSASESSSASTAAPAGGAAVRGPGSPRDRGRAGGTLGRAGRASSTSGNAVRASFPPAAATPHPLLTIPEDSPC